MNADHVREISAACGPCTCCSAIQGPCSTGGRFADALAGPRDTYSRSLRTREDAGASRQANSRGLCLAADVCFPKYANQTPSDKKATCCNKTKTQGTERSKAAAEPQVERAKGTGERKARKQERRGQMAPQRTSRGNLGTAINVLSKRKSRSTKYRIASEEARRILRLNDTRELLDEGTQHKPTESSQFQA